MTSSLRVVEIDPQTDRRWEAFLTKLPNSLIFHHPAWLRVLEEACDYPPVHLACEDCRGQVRGILPLFYAQGFFTGCRYLSLPRTPVAGPLAEDKQALALLLRAAAERASNEKNALFQVKMMSNALDGLLEGFVGVPWRETYVLKLPDSPDQLHNGNSRNRARLKWAVNKAAKLGVEVHPAQTETELRDWYRLYLETMRDIAVPPRPYQFFEVAWKRLHPLGFLRLLLARQSVAGRSRILAGSLFLMFGRTVFYAFSGWRREDVRLRPNDAIQWRAIRDACAQGFRYYDLGEVTKNNLGLAQFKRRWGGEPQWLYRYYYPAPRELETAILDSQSQASELARAAWRRLPLGATVLLSKWAHYYF